MNAGISFQVTLTGTAQNFPDNPVANDITISAPSTNTDSVEIGFTDGVTTSTGFELPAGQVVRVTLRNGNTDQIWVIGTASDKVSVIGT